LNEQDMRLAFVKGDEDALECIVELYKHPLFRYCVTLMCNREDAEDALQETFIKAYEKRKRFDPEKPLLPWLYRLAYTTCVDAIRKRNRYIDLQLLLQKKEGPKEMQQVSIGQDILSPQLYRVLSGLTVKERVLLYGRVFDDQSYKDLSLILNVSESALRKRYERLVLKLAQQLDFEKKTEKELSYEYGSDSRAVGRY
jgi:RNA polymerase sigma-70 factor (ECF subfamily)